MMKKKYLTDKSKDLKLLGQFGLLGSIGALLLFLINLITTYFFNMVFEFYILGLPLVLFILYLPRVIFLLKFPVIILTDEYSKYFNIIGYNKLKWVEFDFATFDENSSMISCELNNGRILNKLDLANLRIEDKNEIITVFESKTMFKTIKLENQNN